MIITETTVLANLVSDEDYARKVLPFLKADYFINLVDPQFKVAFELIAPFINRYNAMPTLEALSLALAARQDLSQADFDKTSNYLDELYAYDRSNIEAQWLIDITERFVKKRATGIAIDRTIDIHSKGKGQEEILKIWTDTLGITFNSNVGHDYLNDYEKRLVLYHSPESRIPFDVDYFNQATRGGLPSKSLSCFMAPTGAGKTAALVSCAAGHLRMGKNVLYITLEMGEDVPGISERLDANLLDVNMATLATINADVYRRQLQQLKEKTLGRLFVKEYPTTTASVVHFRRLLNDLRLNENFVPDILYVDYINICASSRIRPGSDFNSYTYVKYVAEELRGLAVEYNVPVLTATQTNRSGFKNMDYDMEATAESIGLPQTCDLLWALIADDNSPSTIEVKQLKNRWNSILQPRQRFLVGFNRGKMQFYDVNQAVAQSNHIDGRKHDREEIKAARLNFSGVT